MNAPQEVETQRTRPMPWFRMYYEFASDHKVQMLSEIDQRRFVMLLCMRCANGTKVLSDEELSFSLRLTLEDWQATKATLAAKGLIDGNGHPVKWDERQYTSDSSIGRVQKYREKQKALGQSANGYTKHRETVTQRDNYQCVYCGSTENLCLDHVVPVSRGGSDGPENLSTACKACNSGKAGRLPEEAGYSFRDKVAEQRYLSFIKSVTVTVTPQTKRPDQEPEEEKTKSGLVGQGRSLMPSAGSGWRVTDHIMRETRYAVEEKAKRHNWDFLALCDKYNAWVKDNPPKAPDRAFPVWADNFLSTARQ